MADRLDERLRQALVCYTRNGRWGTCASCPWEDGKVWPHSCEFTDRPDHQLTLDALVAQIERHQCENELGVSREQDERYVIDHAKLLVHEWDKLIPPSTESTALPSTLRQTLRDLRTAVAFLEAYDGD